MVNINNIFAKNMYVRKQEFMREKQVKVDCNGPNAESSVGLTSLLMM